jgi:hypothetical protein
MMADYHYLYVKVITDSEDIDTKSRAITLDILKFIHARLSIFAKMGILVKVHKVRSQDLQNANIIDAMKMRGITRLPALVIQKTVYIGINDIKKLYEKNIKTFLELNKNDKDNDNELDNFYKGEMQNGVDDNCLGEGEDMMSEYRKVMENRHGGCSVNNSSRMDNSSRIDSSSRLDNIISTDTVFQDTVNKLARDIDPEIKARAFSSGGGDSLEGDDADPQDDLMERAYWGRIDATEGD